ncbi:hypothetical protein MC7420_8153 [Coleofasciculus chthonoplastes PCC 7420]|uniref:Uncharacterized protein n=1 Tax=Coleofasciculus chthonoplastes PCC 7420 TaxID=118168 RepID=B4W503_9CYAN|nr:hypothetical protein MC7420_8153 [Coleofasciculus chthonoplastes PCC 7420]
MRLEQRSRIRACCQNLKPYRWFYVTKTLGYQDLPRLSR